MMVNAFQSNIYGKCFCFRALFLFITGSQEDHTCTELRALIATYTLYSMSHNADQFSSYFQEDESMSKYLKRTKVTVWTSEIKNHLSCTNVADINNYLHVCMPISLEKHKWLKHASIITSSTAFKKQYTLLVYQIITKLYKNGPDSNC